MVKRNNYEVSTTYAIETIAKECAILGHSSGWSCNYNELEELQKRLSALNIYYANDFFGEWELKTLQS